MNVASRKAVVERLAAENLLYATTAGCPPVRANGVEDAVEREVGGIIKPIFQVVPKKRKQAAGRIVLYAGDI